MIDSNYKAVTVCCASLNAVHALDLMVKSFKKYHPQGNQIWIYDNGSTDGAKELGKSVADRFFDEPMPSHGVSLDIMCKEVQTPYVLVCDSDVEFLAPVVDDMIAENAFCVSPPERYSQGSAKFMEVETFGQPRIDPCCALFRTIPLQELLKCTSFAFYVSPHQGKHYDTGSALYHMAKAVSATMKQPDWLWEKIHHAGSLSWGLSSPEGSEDRMIAEERYARIKERLAEI